MAENKDNTPKRKRDYAAEYKARMERTKGTYNTARRNPIKGTPTGDTYTAFQTAFAFFNERLFEGKLPNCLITLRTFGKARAYFSPDRFVDLGALATTHEIAIDPRQFMDRTSIEILSTVVHEMTHLWQAETSGKAQKYGYHDLAWGTKMKEIGLYPSNTGQPGGKETGRQMTHYIIEGGAFEVAALELVGAGKFSATWADIEGFLMVPPDAVDPAVAGALGAKLPAPKKATAVKSGARVKYTCTHCASAVWGRSTLVVACMGTDETPHDLQPMAAG